MTTLLRRSSSLATSASRRALTALLFREPYLLSPALACHHISSSSLVFPSESPLIKPFACRRVHSSSGALQFRCTDALRAQQQAVDDYPYEQKAHGKNDFSDEGLEISKLGIAEVIIKRLAQKGITKLFPIQRAVLEPAMEGRDMIGRAKTGTGKTLAFGIPIMDKIIQYNAKHGCGRNPLALVLAPTRELARQVEKEFRESSDLETLCAYGGSNIMQQMNILDYGVDVVVGTPGRVIDLIKRGALNLSEVQFLVLDEADQMLAVGFAEDVEIILGKLPPKRQSMMFSATMPSWIRQLTRKYLNDPLTIDLVGNSDQKLAEGISLFSIASDIYEKPSIIEPLVTEHANGGKCIVFTQTKRDADRLAFTLGRRLRCEPLHGDISQAQRERTLTGFRDGRFNVLVATDVAARGLDIPNVDLVIHYELPNSSEIFVHRSGRTGRAGKKGSAILIYSERQIRDVRIIEQHVGSRFKELPRIKVEGGVGLDLFGDSSGGRLGGRPHGAGRFGGSGASFGRSGGYGDSRRSDRFGKSGFGGSRGLDNSGRFGDFGDTGRSRGFGDSGRFGDFGDSGHSRGFGNSGRSGGFGDSGRSRDFGDSERSGIFGSSGRSGGFGHSQRSGGFGDMGRSAGFGDTGRSGGFGDSRRPGGFDGSSSGGFGSGSSSRSGGSNPSRFSFND